MGFLNQFFYLPRCSHHFIYQIFSWLFYLAAGRFYLSLFLVSLQRYPLRHYLEQATRFCPFRGAFIFKVFLGELREKLLEARYISCFVRLLLSLVRHPYQQHYLLSYSILYVWLVVEYHRRSFFPSLGGRPSYGLITCVLENFHYLEVSSFFRIVLMFFLISLFSCLNGPLRMSSNWAFLIIFFKFGFGIPFISWDIAHALDFLLYIDSKFFNFLNSRRRILPLCFPF